MKGERFASFVCVWGGRVGVCLSCGMCYLSLEHLVNFLQKSEDYRVSESHSGGGSLFLSISFTASVRGEKEATADVCGPNRP